SDGLVVDQPNVDGVYDGDTSVTGDGDPNSTIHVRDSDGNVLGTTQVDDNGNYKVNLSDPVWEGMELEVIQSQKDENGDTIESHPVYVKVKSDDDSDSVVIVGDNDSHDGGDDTSILPSTATNTFNWIMGGFLAMIAG